MNAILKKIGYLAMILGGLAMMLGSTGCSGPRHWQRPGWIIPNR
jgi:hypothetical protein